MITNLVKKIPTEREINDLEIKLKAMKEIRTEATKTVLVGSNLEMLPEILDTNSAMKLMKLLQAKLRMGHRKVRGSPVSMELKAQLANAIQTGKYTLGEMANMFNLSISYISRIKGDLKKAGMLGYTDHQLQQHQPSQQVAA